MWEELRAFSRQAPGTTNLCIYPQAPPTPYFLHAMASPAHGCTPVTEIFTLGFAFIGVILSAKNDQELESVFTHPHLLCCWAFFFQLKGMPAKEILQLLKLVLTRSVSVSISSIIRVQNSSETDQTQIVTVYIFSSQVSMWHNILYLFPVTPCKNLSCLNCFQFQGDHQK